MLSQNTTLKSLDLSANFIHMGSACPENKDRPMKFALQLAAGLQDNGALSSVNLLKNGIGVDQADALVKIKESKPNLKSLCGFTLEETELDMSKQGLKPEDAILLASEIPDIGSLSSLNLQGNRFATRQAGAALARRHAQG